MNGLKLLMVAGLLGAIGVAVLGVATFSGNFSPRNYVDGTYHRAADRDLDGGVAKAYTSDRQPTTVADDIAGAWRPADRYADGSGVYLRYADDVITVFPLAAGSLILVEPTGTAYPRYFPVVGGYWGWRTPAEGTRGGGPGAGK